MSKEHANSVPSPIVAVAGWLVPGAGYWLVGDRGRALVVGISIVILFLLGLLIGGMKVVDPPASFNDPMSIVMNKPWFVGQILAGPMTMIAASLGKTAVASHSRVYEIGTLYTAVAGMLNLMAVIDSASRAAQGGKHD